jgi:hypothetical protein
MPYSNALFLHWGTLGPLPIIRRYVHSPAPRVPGRDRHDI